MERDIVSIIDDELDVKNVEEHLCVNMIVYGTNVKNVVEAPSVNMIVRRTICKECGGGSMCEHDRERRNVKNVVEVPFVNMIVFEFDVKTVIVKNVNR